jgi:hypothetical protein
VDWLRRIGRAPPPVAAVAAPEPPAPEGVEGRAPGVAALLEDVSEDRSHAVLDLGPAADASLRVYSRFARWIRFADLLGDGAWPQRQSSATTLLSNLPAHTSRPYDLIFAWDVLDRLFSQEHPRLVQRLAEITAPDARLHLVVRASQDATSSPLRFTLLDVDRMRYEPKGGSGLASTRILPAEVVTLLAPFKVVHAFNLKGGLREYVAFRGRR